MAVAAFFSGRRLSLTVQRGSIPLLVVGFMVQIVEVQFDVASLEWWCMIHIVGLCSNLGVLFEVSIGSVLASVKVHVSGLQMVMVVFGTFGRVTYSHSVILGFFCKATSTRSGGLEFVYEVHGVGVSFGVGCVLQGSEIMVVSTCGERWVSFLGHGRSFTRSHAFYRVIAQIAMVVVVCGSLGSDVLFCSSVDCDVLVLMFHDFGDNGGRAAKELAPKVALVHRFLTSKIGKGVPKIDVKNIVIAGMAVKGLGGTLFVLGSSTGAYLLNIALFGALIFFVEMKKLSPRKLSRKKAPKAKTT
ncbi:HR-like lesion-inducer [Tanacetum coccineum]